jgi:hypothetical protein
MDLNQLLHAHQLAAMSEARAVTRAESSAHAEDVTALAVRIRTLRAGGGVDVSAEAPFVQGEPVTDYFAR